MIVENELAPWFVEIWGRDPLAIAYLAQPTDFDLDKSLVVISILHRIAYASGRSTYKRFK